MDGHHNPLNLEQELFDAAPAHLDIPYLAAHIDDPPQTTQPASLPHPTPEADLPSASLKFFQEFKRIYSVSFNLYLEKTRLMESVGELEEKIAAMEQRMGGGESRREVKQAEVLRREQLSEEARNKRSRRTAEEIEKKYKCEVTYCERHYGSEGSLQQHIKLKHPELLRSEGEPSNHTHRYDDDS